MWTCSSGGGYSSASSRVRVMVPVALRRIDDPETDHAQAGHARDEEIIASARLDQCRHVAAEVRRCIRLRVPLDHHAPSGATVLVESVVAKNRILVVGQLEVVAEIDPLLLHEFELPAQVGVQ